MQEVEVKAALTDKAGVMQKLEALGCTFSEPITQDDTIYARNVGSVDEFLANPLFLRLRVNHGGTVMFTAKYHENRSAVNDTFATEHEVEVSSRDTMEKILLLQGFKEAVRVSKTRQTGHYKEWEICIDELDGFGSFIEVEQLAPEGSDEQEIYDGLCAFLLTLGVPESDITTMRYDILILTHKGFS